MQNNSETESVRTTQKTIDNQTSSSDVCWFCDQPAAEQKWSQEIHLFRNFTTEYKLTGQRHQWEALSRKIACCRKCFRAHKRVERLSRLGTWLGGIIGFILFVILPVFISLRLNIQTMQGLGFIAFILVIAGVIGATYGGYRIGKKAAFYFSPQTKPVEYALRHPGIVPFVEQGWNLGNPANN